MIQMVLYCPKLLNNNNKKPQQIQAKSWRNESTAWRNGEQWKEKPLLRSTPPSALPMPLSLAVEGSRRGCGELGELGGQQGSKQAQLLNGEDTRPNSPGAWPGPEVWPFPSSADASVPNQVSGSHLHPGMPLSAPGVADPQATAPISTATSATEHPPSTHRPSLTS